MAVENDPIRAAIKSAAEAVTDGAGIGDSGEDALELERSGAAPDADVDAGAEGEDAGAAGDASADGAEAAAEGAEADADADTSGAEGAPVEGADDAAASAAAAKPADKNALTDAEKAFAKEHGLSANKNNRIPFARVVKINENAVKKAEVRFRTDILGPVEAKAKVYEDRLQRIGQVEHLMFNDPPAFIEKLKGIPGYAELITGAPAAKGAAGAGGDAGADFALPPPKNDTGYTLEELGGILNNFGASIRKQTLAEVRGVVDKDYGGIKKTYETTEQQRQENVEKERYVGNMLVEANNWEGFKDNAAEILKLVQADTQPVKTLRDFDTILNRAYRKVVFGKQQTTRASVREELKHQPRSTSTARQGAGKAGPVASSDPIRDAIANAAANLRG